MFYYIYQITNLVNGKIYVGVHKTPDLEDGYMGSGKVIKAAIKKYGLDNFRKDILEFFENAELMYAKEKEVVTDEFLLREDTYNLRRGGTGGFDYINNNRTEQYTEARRLNGLRNNASTLGAPKNWVKFGETNPWYGTNGGSGCFRKDTHKQASANLKSRTIEAKEKRLRTFQQHNHQQGEKNSQFGMMWITNGVNNKKIHKSEEIPQGWWKGRIFC
jgi:hypothetical protein